MHDPETGAAAGDTPIKPPAHDLAASSASHAGATAAAVKDPKRLLAPARILVLLTLGLSVVGVGSNALELQFLQKLETGAFASEQDMMAAADANDRRQLIVFAPYLVVSILGFIFVGRWIYFSSKNLRAFGAIGLSIRPGWAVGWYFVPIANLWKPYQAMKEIWQASSDPLDWTRQRAPELMPVWWLLWIISTGADRVAYGLARTAETIADFRLAAYISIASGALYAAACAVLLILMIRISHLQRDAIEHKSTLAVFGP